VHNLLYQSIWTLHYICITIQSFFSGHQGAVVQSRFVIDTVMASKINSTSQVKVLSSCLQHCESSSGECRLECQVAANTHTKPTDLSSESAVRQLPSTSTDYYRHFTQPENWYSFYCPTENRKLSQPRHYRKGAAARAKDRVSKWLLRWMPPLAWLVLGFSHATSGVPPLDHCDLLAEWVWTTWPRLLLDSMAWPRVEPDHLVASQMVYHAAIES